MFDMNKEGKKEDMFNSACEKLCTCYHLQQCPTQPQGS